MPEVISDAERQVAKDISNDAMLMGWDQAIKYKVRELGVDEITIRNLLNRAAEYNDKADPSGRIPNLDDWKAEKRERSELASSFDTRRNASSKPASQGGPSSPYSSSEDLSRRQNASTQDN